MVVKEVSNLIQVPTDSTPLDGTGLPPNEDNRMRRRRQGTSGDDIYPIITLPQSLLDLLNSSGIGVFFPRYSSSLVFFPLAPGTREDIEVGTPVVGVIIAAPVPDLEDNVTIEFHLTTAVSCV